MRIACTICVIVLGWQSLCTSADVKEQELFLFKSDTARDATAWSSLALARPANDRSPAFGDKDHPIKIDLIAASAGGGERGLKLTFSGGEFPAATTSQLTSDDLSAFKSFHADVVASRTCVVIFRAIFQESSRSSMNPATRWEKAALVHAGKNEVADIFADSFSDKARKSKALAFEIGMYRPHQGEAIVVDNIRLSTNPTASATPFREKNYTTPGQPIPLFPKLDKKFKVLGTDWEVADPLELGDRLKEKWVKPEKEQTVEEVEASFQAAFDELKKKHSKAVLARFRDGDGGFDPTDASRKYDGWTDCWLGGHEPGAVYNNVTAQKQPGKYPTYEIFLWRRCPVMRAELSTIPRGSTILAARFILTRAAPPQPAITPPNSPQTSPFKPTMLVAQPCNRAWKETEMNGFQYANDMFWKEICGMDLTGDDPDFSSVILAYGQSKLMVSDWDFTEAVRYWIDGGHENHGFIFYSMESRFTARRNYMDYFLAYSREAAETKKRPCLLVAYVPKE